MGLRSDRDLFVFVSVFGRNYQIVRFIPFVSSLLKLTNCPKKQNNDSTQLRHIPPKQARAVAIRARRASQRGGRGSCQLLPRHVTANPAIQKKSGVQTAAYVREAGTVPPCGETDGGL